MSTTSPPGGGWRVPTTAAIARSSTRKFWPSARLRASRAVRDGMRQLLRAKGSTSAPAAETAGVAGPEKPGLEELVGYAHAPDDTRRRRVGEDGGPARSEQLVELGH